MSFSKSPSWRLPKGKKKHLDAQRGAVEQGGYEKGFGGGAFVVVLGGGGGPLGSFFFFGFTRPSGTVDPTTQKRGERGEPLAEFQEREKGKDMWP